MKITAEWLAAHGPCVDGGAWGTAFVGCDGKELRDCLPAMTRADWLLWLAVEAEVLSAVDLDALVAQFATDLALGPAAGAPLATMLHDVVHAATRVELLRLRQEAADESYLAAVGRSDIAGSARANGLAYFALYRAARLIEPARVSTDALKAAQQVAVQLAVSAAGSLLPNDRAALEHRRLCALITRRLQ